MARTPPTGSRSIASRSAEKLEAEDADEDAEEASAGCSFEELELAAAGSPAAPEEEVGEEETSRAASHASKPSSTHSLPS